MGPGTTGFSSASGYVMVPTVLQLVASACRMKCMKLYLKETVPPPCTIHPRNSVNQRVSDSSMKNFIEAKSLLRQLPHLLPKLVDTLWLYGKEKTSQQTLVGILRRGCPPLLLQDELMELWGPNWAQVCLWVCITCKETKGNVVG